MQHLESPQQECAREVLDVIPIVMRSVRKQLRKHGAEVLTVPQFRTLAFVNRRKGASLSEVADHIGLTLPSMSTLVEGLVVHDFVIRSTQRDDRRRMNLVLTPRGEAMLKTARAGTQAYLAERFSALTGTERGIVVRAMRTLRQVFLEEGD